MEQKKTVLIVEDEKNIVDIIRFNQVQQAPVSDHISINTRNFTKRILS